MIPKRRDDWPKRLDHELLRWRKVPFVWGSADCALFAAACIDAMTGSDLLEMWRGRYQDERTARLLLKSGNCRDVLDAARRHLGNEIDPKLAQRGDVLGVMSGRGPALAICTGSHAAVKSASGLAYLLPDQWVTGWRI